MSFTVSPKPPISDFAKSVLKNSQDQNPNHYNVRMAIAKWGHPLRPSAGPIPPLQAKVIAPIKAAAVQNKNIPKLYIDLLDKVVGQHQIEHNAEVQKDVDL